MWTTSGGSSARLFGQVLSPHTPVSTTDLYGNARPVYRDRRRAGVFQSDTQRSRFQSYQEFGRRTDRRGGFTSFALPGDPRAQRRSRSPRLSVVPFTMPSRLGLHQRTGQSYGAFAFSSSTNRPVDLEGFVRREQNLLASTGLNAPVRRALLRDGVDLSLRSTIERTPAPLSPASPTAGSEMHIDRWLRAGVQSQHERMRRDAWAWFRAGRFRRAARAFEAATLLDESDVESRIGELFSLLSLGASRTATAVLQGMERRGVNPFVPGLNVAEKYVGSKDARAVRTQVEAFASGAEVPGSARALRVIVLWYLDGRDEAFSMATQLAHDDPGGAYAAWPAHMKEAGVEGTSSGDRSVP